MMNVESLEKVGSSKFGSHFTNPLYGDYCFSNIPGYSKSGYFVGNSNSDGPFFYTGFRPAFILAKNTNRL